MRRLRAALLETAAVAALMLAAVAALMPGLLWAVTGPGQRQVVGDVEHVDLAGALWFHWWWSHADHIGASPLRTGFLSYPFGESLLVTSGNFLIFEALSPLVKAAGLLAGFNIGALLIVLLNGLCVYLLLLEVGRNRSVAFFGALFVAASGFCLSELRAGRLEQLALFWMPLSLWALLRLERRRSWKTLLLAAALVALCAYGSWHYGIMLFIGAAVWSAGRAVQRRFGPVRRIAAAMALSALLLLPGVVGQLRAFQAAYGTPTPALPGAAEAGASSAADLVVDHSVSLAHFVVPPEGRRSVFVGVPFLGGLLAILLCRVQGVRHGTWALLWGVSLLLCLGPELKLAETRTGVPLPFAALAAAVPAMERFLWPYRFAALAHVVAVALLAQALGPLVRDHGPRRAVLVNAGLAGLLALQVAVSHARELLPLPVSQVDVPDIYAYLADRPDGAVLELPIHGRFPGAQTEFFYQVFHRKKLLNGSIVTPRFLVPRSSRWVIRKFAALDEGRFFENVASIPGLRRLGLRYVVFNEDKAVGPHTLDRVTVGRMLRALQHVLGPPRVFRDEHTRYLFELPP